MSTDLYKEAIAEAKKLRQIAEEDAKKSIAEEIAPYIKKVISEQINQNSSQFFIEQDEDQQQGEDDLSSLDLAGSEPGGETVDSVETLDTAPDLDAGLGDQAEGAPVSAAGEDILNATMPDAEGKITVDFEDLFAGAPEAEATPGEADLDLGELPSSEEPAQAQQPEEPLATQPSPEQGALEQQPLAGGGEEEEQIPVESVQRFKNSLHEVSEKIDRAYFKEYVPELVYETLKNKLFSLLEENDKLKENGALTTKNAKSNENKLEFLFLKLKEANLNNSYIKKDQKDNSMTSLKEYAAKLFEEDSTYAEDGDKEGTNQPSTASGKHAADVSGVDPNLGQSGPEDLEGREEDGNSGAINEEMLGGSAGSVDSEPLPNTDPEPGKEEQWADGEPSLGEEDQDKVIEEALNSLEEEVEAEGHAGFGDSDEEPAVEFEVDDKEIAEAVRDIRKRSIQEKIRALKEASDGSNGSESWEDAEPEGGDDPSHENLKESNEVKDNDSSESLKEDVVEIVEEDDDMGVANDMAGMPGEEDEVEGDEFGGEEAEGDLVLNIDLPDEVEDVLAGLDLDDVDVDVDVNVEPEAGEEMGAPEVGGEEPGVDVVMHDETEGEPGMEEEGYMKMKTEDYEAEKGVYEAKLRKAGKLYRGLKEQNEKLKADLKEANLFLAKNVYFTKFLQKENLSRKNLTKIVEYLDSAKTVKEAKTIYGKIKAKLSESANASKKLTGSAAKVTKSGSAAPLKESVTTRKSNPSDPVVNTPTRWQTLAGIKTKGE